MAAGLRYLLVLIFVAFQAYQSVLFSQPKDYIEGKVLNSTSQEPVSFAAIKLKNNRLGVFANAGGDFKLINNPEFRNDSIIVTCIGFRQASLAFKDLDENRGNKIYLNPALYSLSEVKVSARHRIPNSITIIGRAIRKIKSNYPVKPFNYISYYRDYQKKDRSYINLNEAVVQTLDEGFSSESGKNKYRLLDFRKNTDFPIMDLSPYYDTTGTPGVNTMNKIIPKAKIGDQYGNELFILMVHDAIRNFNVRSFSFINTFSENFLLNHDFSKPVKVFNNNLLLYRIDFNAKKRITGDSLMAAGAIYIQPGDYSIHKLIYSCSYLNKEKETRKMYNVDIEYGYESSADSLMCLKYISFNNIFNVVDTTDKSYFRVLDSYWREPFQTLGRTMIFEFNNEIDPLSASERANYEIKAGNRKTQLNDISVKGKMLIIRLADKIDKNLKDSVRVTMKNIKDIDGKLLNKRKVIEFNQFRELFVQEYNNSPKFNESFYLQYLPLDQNPLSVFPGKEKYWMNTPESTLIDH